MDRGWLYATKNGLVVPIIPFHSLARRSAVHTAIIQIKITTSCLIMVLYSQGHYYNSSCLLDPSLPDWPSPLRGSSVCTGTCVLVLLLGRARGGFFWTRRCKCVSNVLARFRISPVSTRGSWFTGMCFRFSTHSCSHVSCAFNAFSSSSSSVLVYRPVVPARSSAVRFSRASPKNKRVCQFHIWLLFSACGNSSISLMRWTIGRSSVLNRTVSAMYPTD